MVKRKYWDVVLDEVLNKKPSRRFTTKLEPEPNINKREGELKMYSLGEKYQNIHFSKREAECMSYLLRGKSTRGIAKILGLSPRTVEYYIRIMKKKLNCRTKFELIDLVAESDFMK